jgi:dolichyl-phosphate-mannose--protein O-mannosyl transferase
MLDPSERAAYSKQVRQALRLNSIRCLLLFLLAEALFLINIQFPQGHNFDEFHYVPSAKQWLALAPNQNWEHPPLAKLLMAAGIAIFGDRPIGWRFMSTVFGSFTLVAMYFWGLALFRSKRAALLVAGITLLNQLLYVQARIGMLDTFMFCFIAWGLAFFTASWSSGLEPRRTRTLLYSAGVCVGFATACKWAAVIPWLLCIGLIIGVRVLQAWGVSFDSKSAWARDPGFEEWFTPDLWRGISIRDCVVGFGVIPVLCYFGTFLPYLGVHRTPGYTLWDLITMQPAMYAGQLRVIQSHPYMSQWTGWPLMLRPIWYAFDKVGDGYVRGVLLLGNPWIMWTGLLALAACLWAWIARRSRAAFLILAFYGALYLCWAFIPRHIAFYYYYYPAGMVLSLAVTFVLMKWDRTRAGVFQLAYLAIALACFAYFFPILAALKIPVESFRHWMWFSSWI